MKLMMAKSIVIIKLEKIVEKKNIKKIKTMVIKLKKNKVKLRKQFRLKVHNQVEKILTKEVD